MHIFVFLCMFFLFGCFCGMKFSAVTLLCHITVFFHVFLLKLLIFKAKTLSNLKAIFLVIFFTAGAMLGVFYDYNTFKEIKPFYGREITVSGIVTEKQEAVFIIDTDYGLLKCRNYNEEISVKRFDTVVLKGEVGDFRVSQYKGDSDLRAYNALRGIVGTITCKEIEVTGYNKSFSLWDAGVSVRLFMEDKINNFPANSEVKGFIIALLTGNTDSLDPDVKEAFRLAGISHLVAVSGLHVSIFISFFWLFSFTARKNKLFHILFILTLVGMYVLVIGERASVLRAGIMTVCSYMAFNIKRRSDPLMNLMLAGVLICLVNPYYIVDVGFLMSFLVTMGIIIFAPFFKRQAIAVPAIATLVLLPVTAYYYNTISLETIVVNVMVVSLVAPLILFGYLGCVLLPLSKISCILANFIIVVAKFFASIDWLHIPVPSPGIWELQMWVIIICTVYIIFKSYDFKTIVVFVAVIIYLASISPAREEFYQNAHTVRFINSGNYNMIHITTQDKREILIDCGNDSCDYALKNGIKTFDTVLISSPEKERYIDLEELSNYAEVKNVLLPSTIKAKNLQLENSDVLYYNENDYDFTLDGIRFKFRLVDGQRCLLMELFGKAIAVPFGDEISSLAGFNVICVPDKCTDSDTGYLKAGAKFYIHATHRYKYYDCGNKYVTSQTGMAEIIFYNDSRMFLKNGW